MSTQQFVTFRIDSNLLGIDILNVREINRILDITPVQHAPDYIRGLVNLRGQTVTVFDLGIRLGLSLREITAESHNIILKNDTVGLLVDSIGDVVNADETQIKPPPANIGKIESEFVDGVVRLDEKLLVVLSAQRVLEYTDNHKGKNGTKK